MPTRAEAYTLMNGYSEDLSKGRHNLETDALHMVLVTDVITAATATNFAFTQVTGNNYTAGGLACNQTLNLSALPIVDVESTTNFLWSEDAAGFNNAATALIYNTTSGRIIAFADIRDEGNGQALVDSTGQDVDINLENTNRLFSLGR